MPDHALNREIALGLLGNTGARLETAANGREALEFFKKSRPGYYDLILMDIQMPIMDGYEAARAIRALARDDSKTVPIFVEFLCWTALLNRMGKAAGIHNFDANWSLP